MEVLPDIAREYSQVVDAARTRIISDLTIAARMELARLYVEEMDTVFSRLRRGEIDAETARGLVRSLEAALRRYNAKADPAVKQYVIRALDEIRRSHKDALKVIPGTVNASFQGLATEAFEELYKRRRLGVVQTFKTLSRHSAQSAAGRIALTLQEALLTLSPEQAVFRIATDLAGGNAATMAALEQYGSPTGMKRFMRGAPVLDDEAFRAARKIGYDAWRIVRTELAAAAHEGDRIGAIQSPVVAGLQWRLSPRHPKPDICDVYAKVDMHGLGAGVFPPELLPVKPHPHDLCFNTHVFREVDQWTLPKEAPNPAKVPNISHVAGILQGETTGAIRRAMVQVERDTRRALQSWESLAPKLRGSS